MSSSRLIGGPVPSPVPRRPPRRRRSVHRRSLVAACSFGAGAAPPATVPSPTGAGRPRREWRRTAQVGSATSRASNSRSSTSPSRRATTPTGGSTSVPERDRPGPHPARRRRGPSTLGSATGRASSRRPAGIPIEYVATIYGQFPNVVFAKASTGIKTAADLKGKKIGTPGRYGSGWIMLQALLGSAGLTPDDVEIVEYPDFTQETRSAGRRRRRYGLRQQRARPARAAGDDAVVLRIDDITPLPGPGLIAVDRDARRQARRHRRVRGGDAPGDERDQRRPGGRARRRDHRGPGAGHRADARRRSCRDHRFVEGHVQTDHGLGAIDRDGWTASITFMTARAGQGAGRDR